MATTQKYTLDFLVIGASKSGTTTLYEWMRHHPGVEIPPGKEVPFFTDETVYQKGLTHYCQEHFPGANSQALWGTVTPQYLQGIGDIMPEDVAKRIRNDLPEAKLIAVLRHPIERAHSHYKMSVRRGYETRSFEQAAMELLQPEHTEEARTHQTPTNVYFAASEYGRILSTFYDLLPGENIQIFFAHELKEEPKRVLREIFTFLGVDENFTPPNIEKEYHQGGSRPKTKMLTPEFIYKIPGTELVWKNFVPSSVRSRINFRINRWNIKADQDQLDTETESYQELVRHFAPDVEKLVELIGKKPSWPEWQ